MSHPAADRPPERPAAEPSDDAEGWGGLVRRSWVGAALNVGAVAGAVSAYVVSSVASASSGRPRVRFLVLGAVLTGAVVVLGALKQLRDARRVRTAAQVAVQAEEELLLALNGALAPLTNYLGEIADAPLPARAGIAGQLRQAAVDAAVRLTVNDSRSAFYAVDDEALVLTREAYAGRSTLPRPQFTAGTADGDFVLDLVDRGDLVFIGDVDENPLVAPSVPGTYRTVVAVAVTAGARRLGMLTVDAPRVGDLTGTDVELVRVLANLLGSGLAQSQ